MKKNINFLIIIIDNVSNYTLYFIPHLKITKLKYFTKIKIKTKTKTIY